MYEDFFGLKGKPFQLNPDPSFLYASSVHKSALAYLRYGLYQGEGFIMITGEIGAGKTTLIRSIIEQIDSREIIAAQLVSTQLDADNLLRAVATAFGVPSTAEHKAHILAELERFFTALVPEKRRAVLIVDEAQNLSPRAVEELRMLSNFQVGDRALLQSILVGQPELREVMRSSRMKQLRQRVIASYHLGPMNQEETRGYVEHRLACVGWAGDPQFTPEAMEEIYKASEGVPRRINTLCSRLLLSGYLEERHVFSGEDVRNVVAEMTGEDGVDFGVDAAGDKAGAGTGRRRNAAVGEDSRPELNLVLDRQEGADFASINQRLQQLEKTMFTVLDLLDDLVRGPEGRAGRHERKG